jgi:hypothetical protein
LKSYLLLRIFDILFEIELFNFEINQKKKKNICKEILLNVTISRKKPKMFFFLIINLKNGVIGECGIAAGIFRPIHPGD